jgi:hypothetical protein
LFASIFYILESLLSFKFHFGPFFLTYFFLHYFMLSHNAHKIKSQHDAQFNGISFYYLFIYLFLIWCSQVMIHTDQTHIKRNCFSIGIILSNYKVGVTEGVLQVW